MLDLLAKIRRKRLFFYIGMALCVSFKGDKGAIIDKFMGIEERDK